MIPAAGIEDQELPIAAKWAGVNHPAVAWGGNLSTGPGGDGEPFLGSTDAVGGAELADSRAIDRQTQMPAGRREGYGRGKTPRILQGSEIGTRRILADGAGVAARRALGGVEARFE